MEHLDFYKTMRCLKEGLTGLNPKQVKRMLWAVNEAALACSKPFKGFYTGFDFNNQPVVICKINNVDGVFITQTAEDKFLVEFKKEQHELCFHLETCENTSTQKDTI